MPLGPSYGLPALTDTGQRLYDACEVLADQDQQNGYPVARLCAGLATMIDQIANLVRDPDEGSSATPGWGMLFDLSNYHTTAQQLTSKLDAKWLPWIAQFVGIVDLPPPYAVISNDFANAGEVLGYDTTNQINLIEDPISFQRGSVAAMKRAAAETLTNSQTVLINEFAGGDPWQMTASTFTSETPDTTATLKALMSMKPAGVILTYTTVTGGTYSQLATSHAQYSQMEAAHTTYSNIPENPGA